MRQTGLQNSGVRTLPKASLRALRIAAVALGIGLVLSTGAVRADDDEEEAEPSLMDNLMSGIGAKRAGDTGIKYRERSPLVVPSKIDLPPPSGKKAPAANWPKDPDEIARKEAIEAAKASTILPSEEVRTMGRALMPNELAAPKGAGRTASNAESTTPGAGNSSRPLSPSELGYKGGIFSGMFGGNKGESAPFKGEPPRQTLSQPPVGYQTPSPNYKYGSGPAEAQVREYNPAAGKYGDK